MKIAALQSNVTRLMENHIPHLDAKIEGVRQDVSGIKEALVKLSTIIEERIPKK